ncbi:uncharacterized protein TRIADDRAFT_52473 [Trichoplax adhaerens]|uniref:15-cis-phytoene synthase n=1 Tax=Trichoplax adhaerens TaxID=10228 RepID=B3RIN8_TRIAD|nr:hypothetical protein TRIADDRAFT_52473 [Trichoplax adhaerens]EDV29016.1 hypothetical protein TRIADDRAFT_52473 [Trichoplax adhaerens]|eukprot:XP_002108218.1 hypothetical protein TRIADDRAFT_52473 [Trichoplax adhaerens]
MKRFLIHDIYKKPVVIRKSLLCANSVCVSIPRVRGYLINARQFTSNERRDDGSNVSYCMNLVRKHDFENYLTTLLLPKDSRNSVFAIRAFNLETIKIKDIISQPGTGEMRIKFWASAIESIYKNEPPQHPIAMELMKAKDKNHLSKMWFNRLVKERKRRLDDSPYRNLEELEAYCENTVSSILYLILESLGIRCSHSDHAASHIGKAYGIVILLRAVPFHAKKGKVYLPSDILIKARSIKKDVSRKAVAGFLCSVICQKYLRDLQFVDFDVFHPNLQERAPLLPVQLLIQRLRGVY